MINILFSGNDKVFDGVLTCILSILKRSRLDEPFTFFIMTMDVSYLKDTYVPITEKQCAFLESVVKSYSPESRVVRLDVTEHYKKEFDACPNEQCYCSPYTLLRLFSDEIEEIPSKLLYLDVDVLLVKDIHLLYDIDLTGYEYAAARDHYGKFLVHPNYINAGVILFNMDEVRRTGLLVKARELIRTKKLVFADQSAIYRSTTKKMMLSQRFNDQKFLYKGTVIRHFSKRLFWTPYPHTDNIKQWHVSKMYSRFHYTCFDDVIYEYIYLKGKFEHEA